MKDRVVIVSIKSMFVILLIMILMLTAIPAKTMSAKTYKYKEGGKMVTMTGVVKREKNVGGVTKYRYVLKFSSSVTIIAFGSKYKTKKIVLSVHNQSMYKKYRNKKVKIKGKLVTGDDDFVLQSIKSIKKTK